MDILELSRVRAESERRHFLDVLLEELDKNRPEIPPCSEDCVSDKEIGQFCGGTLISSSRLDHIEHCLWCRRVLADSIHSGNGFWERLRDLQAKAVKTS